MDKPSKLSRKNKFKVTKRKKPLKIDCSSLLNHLQLIQKSIPHLHSEDMKKSYTKPNVQMLNFQSAIPSAVDNHETKEEDPDQKNSLVHLRDWYILVASTPCAISAQLISIPSGTRELPDVVIPDLIHCTPISVWTCSNENYDSVPRTNGSSEESTEKNISESAETIPGGGGWSGLSSNEPNKRIEILSCSPQVIIQEPDSLEYQSDFLQVAVVCGTDQNRVLSIQLSIISYIGMQGCEGRFVLTKTQKEEGVVEPLIVDTQESILKKKKMLFEQHPSSSGQSSNAPSSYKSKLNEDGTTSVTSASRDDNGSSHPATDPLEWVPFCPRGGVQSISPVYRCKSSMREGNGGVLSHKNKVHCEFLWITYGDGTFVRMPKWAFFGWKDVSDDLDHPSCHAQDLTFKGRLDLTQSNGHGTMFGETDGFPYMVIPLPRFFPTLLSQPTSREMTLLRSDMTLGNDGDQEDLLEEGETSTTNNESSHEFFEAICYKKNSSVADCYPSLGFYTNEDQFLSNTHKVSKTEDQISTVRHLIRGGTTLIGGTAALARNMLGGMMGVLGRSKSTVKEDGFHIKGIEVGENETNDLGPNNNTDFNARLSLFPALNRGTSVLKLASALYDSPRQITHVAIDPLEGKLLACSDNLGRVQLIDLESKQPIRMWKGFRDATCHWIQFPYSIDGSSRTVKYLAIHSRQRNVVEIFRMPYGPRVGKFDVKSESVSLIQCPVNLSGGEVYERTFELRTSKGSSKSSILKEVTIIDDELIKASREGSKSVHVKYLGTGLSPAQKRAQEGTIHMQLLKQLLATESAVPSDLHALYEALTQITAISDLSKALDLLSTSVHLHNMGVMDSSFHSEVVLHAREQLDDAMDDPAVATSKNSHIEELSTKIDLHTQLILAYDEIHEFENSEHMNTSLETIDNATENSWVVEAVAWRETFEKVTGRSIDMDIPTQTEKILSFATFAKACLQDSPSSYKRNKAGNLVIRLCDSTKDRKQILVHMFGPLTKDVFSSKSTYQAFEHLGLIGDFETLLLYYGEWFMSLPKAQIEKQCNGVLCPLVRWLHDMVLDYMESDDYTRKKETGKVFLLETLHNFCCETADLPRAFLLASVCHDAILFATQNIEDKTYGLITCEDCVKPWEKLLRKLRVCLCMSLRLHGVHIGPVPITVSNIESGDIFSVHQLIAHDELAMVQMNDKIIAIEMSCIESPDAFHPSTTCGDEPNKWKFLQASCIACSTNSKCTVNSHVEMCPSLLLQFFLHFFDPVRLASHRTLILAQKWGENPDSIHHLENALSSMRSIHDLIYLSAICQEVWNNNIRPVYRALLFGFHEAHELCEEIFVPLLNDMSWMRNISKIALEILTLLRSTVDVTPSEETFDLQHDNPEVWPPLQKDFILNGILKRSGSVDDSSIETHSAVICALQLTDDLSSLFWCFPTMDVLFLRESISEHQSLTLSPTQAQDAFINDALRRKAMHFDGNAVNYDDLEDITTLARAWGLDKSNILTEFLIVMYEQGKDDSIQHLITSTRLIEVERFQDGCMSIACVRLNAALITLKKAKKYRHIISLLDADTCEWVKEQAEVSNKEKPGSIATHRADGKLISLENTQDLILRIKRMSTASRIDATALSSMVDVLIKAGGDIFE